MVVVVRVFLLTLRRKTADWKLEDVYPGAKSEQ
jgi:hypothetical protein